MSSWEAWEEQGEIPRMVWVLLEEEEEEAEDGGEEVKARRRRDMPIVLVFGVCSF
jgi:hypothetical protein